MTEETDLVEADEYVLRRIVNRDDYINLALKVPVSRLAFEPTRNDTTGISLFRSLFASPKEVADAGPNPAGYWVAELPVVTISNLKLTVNPSPRPTGPGGHCLIPEIRTDTKKVTKEYQRRLAELASARLVFRPT